MKTNTDKIRNVKNVGGAGPNTAATNGREVIGVPRNYIVGTLCRDESALSAFGESLFGPVETGTLGVAKGLLLYTILLEGEYSIVKYLPAETKAGRGEILDIPMSFMPRTMCDRWRAIVTGKVSHGVRMSVNEIRELWRGFIISAFSVDGATYGPGFVGATENHGYDVSRGLMLYTLYREGEMAVHGGFTGRTCRGSVKGLSVKMNFLPTELSKRWQKIANELFAANPSVTEHDVVSAWRNFVVETVGTDAGKYVESFSTLIQGGRRDLFNSPNGTRGADAFGVGVSR